MILLLVMGLIPACNQMRMTRYEYGDIRIDVGGRLEGGPGEPVALGPMPTGFARFGPRGRMITIEAKFVEVTEQSLVDLQFWPGRGQPLLPSTVTDLTPKAPQMTMGFGFGFGGGGGDQGYYDDGTGSGNGIGTGVGIGVPLSVDGERGITYLRSTFELEVTPFVDDGFLLLLVALKKQADGRILTQPMILPTAIGFGGEAAGAPTPQTVDARVLIVDGETFLIDGVLQGRDEIIEKVPLLGDLPMLNRAFRGDDSQIIKKDLIVFLAPHVVLDPGQ